MITRIDHGSIFCAEYSLHCLQLSHNMDDIVFSRDPHPVFTITRFPRAVSRVSHGILELIRPRMFFFCFKTD
jgi:hypothetical protein